MKPSFRNPLPGLFVLSACLIAPLALAQTTYPEPRQPPQQSTPQTMEAPTAPTKSFAELDRNADGKVSKSEAAADPSVSRKFASHDTNQDGQLTEAEYAGQTKDTGTQY